MILGRSVVVEHLLLPVGTLAVRPGIGISGSHAGIDAAFIVHEGILAGIQDFTLAPRAGPAVGEIVRNARGTFDAFLGGNQNNAVGSTGSVNGTCSSILEHFDGLDILRIQVVDTVDSHGHAIHDV